MAEPPSRSPLACGALGRYRPDFVAEIARRLEVPMRAAHRDRHSILLIDRPAIRWGRWPGPRGFAWSELPDPEALELPTSREDAATRLRACGLAIEGRRRLVHSSVTGIAPVYYLDRDGATYFASRIDPLVGALGGPLSVDWEAWASIFCLGHPVGAGTPFAEVRVLRPFELLRRDETRSRVVSPEWPWQRTSSVLSVAEGVGPMLDALRESIAPLASRPAISLLSGGLDSRLLLALLVEAGADVRALTLGGEDAHPIQRALASQVAGHYGVEHEVFDYRDPGHYLAAWAEHSLAVDYQRARAPSLTGLGERLAAGGRIAWDGLALDALATHSSPEDPWFYTDEMFARRDGSGGTARALWFRLSGRAMGRGHERAFTASFAGRLARASRRALVRDSRPLRGHRSQAILLFYRNRTVRGVSTLPYQVLGAHASVRTAFADDGVARAILDVDPREKASFRLYDAAFAAVDPAVRALASSLDPKPDGLRPAHELRSSAPVLARFEELLRAGPLARHHGASLRRALADRSLGRAFDEARGLYRASLALALFGEWRERYGGILRSADPDQAPELAVADGPPDAPDLTPA